MNRYKLMRDLVEVFEDHNVKVHVGITSQGIVIKSEDYSVDAVNLYFSPPEGYQVPNASY